ncbi:MAG: polyprenyl synthetase family protein [Alphaproteobacteria bacterium]|nr:polyprenyl synthetase family protein [Alphaproteobacteria bacterium]
MTEALANVSQAVNHQLERLLPKPVGPEARLFECMRYSAFAGGKRFRPFLVIASADLFGVAKTASLRVAAAIEMVHTYSLMHDDLPCMDDDDLRRGQPTAHKQFDEATALLAGNALATGEDTHSDPSVRVELIRSLAAASGGHGMMGGQVLDLAAERQALDMPGITRLQQLKTGAIIAFSCEAGAVLGKAAPSLRQALRHYAHDLGLAFQMADDLLDHEGSAEEMGKAVGKDAGRGKATFVSLLGPEQARTQAQMLADQAARQLDAFGEKADLLRAAATFVVERRS